MHRLQPAKISPEENETTLVVDHHTATFSIYTTCSKVARMVERQFPTQFALAPDGASATANDVPLADICKVRLSSLK